MATNGDGKKWSEKVGERIKENLPKLLILIVSAVYVFEGTFSLIKKSDSILVIIGNIGLSIAVGVVISSLLTSSGIRDGRRSEIFQSAMKAYGEAKASATKYFAKISPWCEYKNAIDLENRRKEIINSAGLSWKGFKYGYYDLHPEKLTSEQVKLIKKAKTCTIKPLKAEELLSDVNTNFTKFEKKFYGKFGPNEKQYQARDTISSIVYKFGTGIICGLYTLEPILTGEVWAGVLWNALQILIWMTFGIMKYVNAKSFMEYDYRQSHIIQKTEYINEFFVTMETHPEVIDKYDDEAQVDQYIEDFIKEKLQNDEQKKQNNDSSNNNGSNNNDNNGDNNVDEGVHNKT